MPESQPGAERPVVVGVDGSDSALAAVDTAAGEAAMRGRPLHVVHAFIWPLLNVPIGPSRWGPPEGGLRNQAERILQDAVARASQHRPGLCVTGDLLTGGAAPLLIECSRWAELVVVGDRGLGGFTGLLVGSVAVALAAHAACPVLIVRGEERPAAPVVVGVDGSPANEPALGYAFESARLRNAPLVVLHARALPRPPTPRAVPEADSHLRAVEGETCRALSEALAGWTDRYPEVEVRRVDAAGDPRIELVNASTSAQLLVVGSRGRGGFTGLLLGSVSQAAIQHARCPVAVVPREPGSTGDRGVGAEA
jgi:nucleotide-binding universal stress UspA family protein